MSISFFVSFSPRRLLAILVDGQGVPPVTGDVVGQDIRRVALGGPVRLGGVVGIAADLGNERDL